MAVLEAAIAHKLKCEAPAELTAHHDPVDFLTRPTCCETCQLAYDQVRAVCGASFEAFGAQWQALAPTILKALDAPAPCLLCGEPEVVTGALYRPHTPAMFDGVAAMYFLCKACYALPREELSLRTEAMLARCLVGHRN
jgi:hypothetical protein